MKDGIGGGAKKSTDAAHLAATRAFAERLNALMRENGTGDRELARAVGVTPQAVRCWKSGGNMPYGNRLRQVADFFGVSADYMTGVWTPRKARAAKSREEPPAGELFGAEDEGKDEPSGVCVRTWLSPEQKARLDAFCGDRGLTLSAALRQAVDGLLDRDDTSRGTVLAFLSKPAAALLAETAAMSGKSAEAEASRILADGILKEWSAFRLFAKKAKGDAPRGAH